MKKLTNIALGVGLSLSVSSVFAAQIVADARGNGMGNTGVATATYITAPFYNPALGAIYSEDDDFGLLLPAIGVNANDPDEVISLIDDLDEAIENEDFTKADEYLDALEEGGILSVSGGAGIAVAIPLATVSTNFFAHGHVEIMSQAEIDDSTDVQDRYNSSQVDTQAFAYSEFGVSLSKSYMISDQQVSFGVSPKYQVMRTYSQVSTLEDFDLSDYEESENNESAFNFDIGAAWYTDHLRVALALKDVISQEIELKNSSGSIQDVYELNPQATFGFAYINNYFTAALDADLTKQERFKSADDNTQFVRVGIEGNAWDWLQLRAGYEMDLEDTLDDSITAGFGISPWDVVHFDLAASYAGSNQLGGAANLYLSF